MVELGRHSAHHGVGSSTDNDLVPGFGEGEVPGFSNGSGGFGGKRKWELANGGGHPNGTSMSSATAVDGQEPHSRQKAGDWAYLWNGNGGGHGGAGSGCGSKWNGLSGVCRVTNSRSALALASIHSFSFFLRHGLCRKFAGMPRYDRKDVGYCNMYMGNGEEDTCG